MIRILSTWQFLSVPHRYRKNQMKRLKVQMFAKLHAHQSTEIWYTIFLLLQREPYGNIWEFDKVFYMWPTEHKKRNYQTTYKTREKNSKNCERKIPWNWWQQKFIIKLVGIYFMFLIDMKHWHVSKNTFPNDFSHFWSNQNKYFFSDDFIVFHKYSRDFPSD